MLKNSYLLIYGRPGYFGYFPDISLEILKFCRHAGLDPASSFIMLLELFWIPAFAGMTKMVFFDFLRSRLL